MFEINVSIMMKCKKKNNFSTATCTRTTAGTKTGTDVGQKLEIPASTTAA